MRGDSFREKVHYYMNSGNASGDTELNAFDRAMIQSGCGNYNLLKVSSILPPEAERTNRIELKEGSLLPVAYACLIAGPDTYLGCSLAASVAVGIPKESNSVGVIMEYEGVCSEEVACDKVLSMVKTAMADRGINEYSIKYTSAACISKADTYNCVFAYIALF